MKLPKQWKHWCRINGLRPFYGGITQSDWFYLRGRGHVWRVNCHNEFECGDKIEEFCRWALCDIERTGVPRNKESFKVAVDSLLEVKEKKDK